MKTDLSWKSELMNVKIIDYRKQCRDIIKVEQLDWRIPFREDGDNICSENRREKTFNGYNEG